MFKILIVEDDEKIADIMVESLQKAGHAAESVKNFSDIMPEFIKFEPDLVLLDIILPYYDGFYWCGKIRFFSKIPIMFVSSKSEDIDIIIATNMGGDDYITKPFSIDVLVAKVSGLLRRAYSYDNSKMDVIAYKDLVLNIGSGVVSANGKSIELTKNEAQILTILLRNQGNTVSRERIMRKLWKDASFIDDNTLTVNITRIRRKLSDIGLEDYIVTKKSLGYMI